MKCLVTRTSLQGDDDVPPCPEARRENYTRIDERTTDDPAKVGAHHGESDWWYSAGRNHRVERGCIKRDIDDTGWFVELSTLDELMAFVARHGELVIGPYYANPAITRIEIYDSYRE